MPQLDLLTLSIQISVIFFFSWSLFSILVSLILPQYIRVSFAKKLLWGTLNSLIAKIKFYSYLCYAHEISTLTLLSLTFNEEYLEFKKSSICLSKGILKKFLLKTRLVLFAEIFYYKVISLVKTVSVKLNFYVKKPLLYFYSRRERLNYLTTFNRGSKLSAVLVLFEVIEFWTWDDIIYLEIPKNEKK